MTVPAGSQLSLAYAFVPTPSPILASPAGGNPNTVGLQVIVSSPSYSDVTVSSITIEIPIGDRSAGSLSQSRALPSPTMAPGIPWEIATQDDTVTITPTGSGAVSNPIVFSLEDVPVNETPGTVNLQITEYPPGGQDPASDNTTYVLVKQPSTCPLLTFSASPATLEDIHQDATLTWTTADHGTGPDPYSYGLRIVEQAAPIATASRHGTPRDTRTPLLKACGADGACYTAAEGAAGVAYGPVPLTTTFAVDAYYAESAGHLVSAGSLQTTAEVVTPWFSPNSYVVPSATGRFASLHWLAFNADACTVQVDGIATGETLPVDTYDVGAWIMLQDSQQPHTLAIFAQHRLPSGKEVTTQKPLAPVGMQAVAPIAVGNAPVGIAVTPDSSLALVCCQDGTVQVLDLSTLKVATSIPTGPHAEAIAITPDGVTALVLGHQSGTIGRINIPARSLLGSPLTAHSPNAVAITPDGRLALVTEFGTGNLQVIDLATWSFKAAVRLPGRAPGAIAVKPDGSLALIADSQANHVSVVDLATLTVESATVTVGRAPMGIAVTPDGTRAYVTNQQSNTLQAIDIASRTAVLGPIKTPAMPGGIAITPDGRFAITSCYEAGVTQVLDIEHGLSRTLDAGLKPTSVAIAPNGAAVLVANMASNTVSVY